MDDSLGLPSRAFDKLDPEDDAVFYAPARLVAHIDNPAIAAVTALYRQVLPDGGVLLDLMSSWISHLPLEARYGEVIGHGMNAAELVANPRLDRWFVRDLNREPSLPLDGASVDAAMICVSVQYLQQPVAVLRDVARALKPGGAVVISLSNRCFPTKAVAIWSALDGDGHAELVERYLSAAGFGAVETLRLLDGRRSDPLTAVIGRAPG